MTDPRGSVQILVFAGAVLAMAAGGAVWTGMRLAAAKGQAATEGGRLERVHEALADEAFRAELVEALEAKRQDTQMFRGRLSDLARKSGILLDGSITETRFPLPNLGMVQVDAALAFKDVSLARFLNFACAIEQDVPDAVITDASLKPIPSAGDRWEVRLKVSKRLKAQ